MKTMLHEHMKDELVMMRRGASMLELVIAIVVMGIAVSALPLILTQSQNSNAMALQQEAILATKAKMSYILAYEWDANSFDTTSGLSRVLDTTTSANADNSFDANNSTRRVGHINADKRRRLWDVEMDRELPYQKQLDLMISMILMVGMRM